MYYLSTQMCCELIVLSLLFFILNIHRSAVCLFISDASMSELSATECTREEMIEMIGLIAGDIRGSWSYGVIDRIGEIRKLYMCLKQECPDIDEESATSDGRWFRDTWTGYYETTPTFNTLSRNALIYLCQVLHHPQEILMSQSPLTLEGSLKMLISTYDEKDVESCVKKIIEKEKEEHRIRNMENEIKELKRRLAAANAAAAMSAYRPLATQQCDCSRIGGDCICDTSRC
jgi:hypothetical protein